MDGWAIEVKKWMEWQDIDLYNEVALELVGFLVGGQATVIYNQYLRNNPIVGDFFSFLLHLRKELVPSNSRDKLWFAWEGSTQVKNGEIRDMNTFSRELNELQMKIIDLKGNQAILDDVKKFKFYSGLQPQIREKIRPFISWTIDYAEIVQKAEHQQSARMSYMTEPIDPRKRAQKAAKAKFKKEIRGREMIPMDKPPRGTKCHGAWSPGVARRVTQWLVTCVA